MQRRLGNLADMSNFLIEEYRHNALAYASQIMKALKENLFNHYTLTAFGKKNMKHLDEVERFINRWIVVISVEVIRKTKSCVEYVVLTFKRHHWFREKFYANKA